MAGQGTTQDGARRTQAGRRAASRGALLEAAARGISREGYAALSLEQVAREAGYTRGALYHQFAGKEALALAVVDWVTETWEAQVGCELAAPDDPVARLTALARAHAVYCRRDLGGVLLALRVEFAGRDHPVATEIEAAVGSIVTRCARMIEHGRADGVIPPGPPAADVAHAIAGALESVVLALEGRAPHDELLAERAVRGLLGLPVS